MAKVASQSSIFGRFLKSRAGLAVRAQLQQGRTKFRSRQTRQEYYRYSVIIAIHVANRGVEPVFIRRVLGTRGRKKAELTSFDDGGLLLQPGAEPSTIVIQGDVLTRQVERLMLVDFDDRVWDVPGADLRQMRSAYAAFCAEVDLHNATVSFGSAAGATAVSDDDANSLVIPPPE